MCRDWGSAGKFGVSGASVSAILQICWEIEGDLPAVSRDDVCEK